MWQMIRLQVWICNVWYSGLNMYTMVMLVCIKFIQFTLIHCSCVVNTIFGTGVVFTWKISRLVHWKLAIPQYCSVINYQVPLVPNPNSILALSNVTFSHYASCALLSHNSMTFNNLKYSTYQSTIQKGTQI